MSYAQLARHLEAQTTSEVPVSFAEVERVIGRPLPDSAAKHQAWWANTRSHSHAHAWLDAGWRTARLSLAGRRVTFVRNRDMSNATVTSPEKAHLSARPSPEVVTLPMSALTAAARRILDEEVTANGGDAVAAIAELLHRASIARKVAIMTKWQALSKPGSDSVDLVREIRDEE